jgi:nitrate reductase delta subunit
MTDEDRTLCKVLSFLLDYPAPESLPAIAELHADRFVDWKSRRIVQEFVDYLSNTPLIRRQEIYTATFDLDPSTSLNLTYHRWGDSKERASALVRLVHLYAQGGYEIADGELPDYLPLVLEFLSVGPPGSAREIMAEYHPQVSIIASRLAETSSPYAALVEGAAHLLARGDTTLMGG